MTRRKETKRRNVRQLPPALARAKDAGRIRHVMVATEDGCPWPGHQLLPGLPAAPRPPGGKRAYLYARISDKDREKDPAVQLADIEAAARAAGLQPVERGWDLHQSGDADLHERETGRRVLEAVRNGEIDWVVTLDSSRLTRQHPTHFFLYLQWLRSQGVGWLDVAEPYLSMAPDEDPTSREARMKTMMRFVHAWANWDYRFTIIEKTKSTLAKKPPGKRGGHKKNCGVPFALGGAGPCPTGVHLEDGSHRDPGRRRTSRTPHSGHEAIR